MQLRLSSYVFFSDIRSMTPSTNRQFIRHTSLLIAQMSGRRNIIDAQQIYLPDFSDVVL